jgi:peptide/nickel transport system substrate-binding protein
MKRRILAMVVFALSVLAACSGNNDKKNNNTVDLPTPVPGDWAVVRYEGEPDTLNPILNHNAYSAYIMYGVNSNGIYDFLLAYNTTDYTFSKPVLVEALPTASQDHLIYTFTLRDGIKWHDGQPLTPEDVLFTFKAAMCPLVDSASQRSYLTDLADVQIEGRNIRFVMARPNSNNLVNLGNTLAIIPKHVFDAGGLLDSIAYKDIIGAKGKTDPKVKQFSEQFNIDPANRAPVGTGPFKFEKWDSGERLSIVRNNAYFGTKPYLDKIVLRFMQDYPAALTALKAGEIDVQQRLLPVQYAQQTSGPAFDEQLTKTKYSIPGVFYIIWNHDRPFFRDKRVRQALTMLVDRQKIIQNLRFGLGTLATSPINPKSFEYNPNIQPLPYDPARAAQLLDEAGWTDHNGDGLRDKDGMKFKFDFLGATNSTIFPQLAALLKEEFRKVGIEVVDRVLEFNAMNERLKDHNFDASSLGTTSDLIADPYQNWHSSSAQSRGSNYGNFNNRDSDRLLEQARLEFDPEKRKQIYWRWQELIHDQQPYTFLYYLEDSAAYSKRFQNVQWLPLRPGFDLTTWWVPKSMQKYGDANSATAVAKP